MGESSGIERRDAGACKRRAVHVRRDLGAARRRHQCANRDGMKRRSELAARGEARLRPHLLPQRRAHLPVAVPAG